MEDQAGFDRQAAHQLVRVQVAGEQGSLEEEEGSVPDRRRAAQQRQHLLGDEGLEPEQEERGEEEGENEKSDRAGSRAAVGDSVHWSPLGRRRRRPPLVLVHRYVSVDLGLRGGSGATETPAAGIDLSGEPGNT